MNRAMHVRARGKSINHLWLLAFLAWQAGANDGFWYPIGWLEDGRRVFRWHWR
jgi:hypothetical protein